MAARRSHGWEFLCKHRKLEDQGEQVGQGVYMSNISRQGSYMMLNAYF